MDFLDEALITVKSGEGVSASGESGSFQRAGRMEGMGATAGT
jgi:hypothetical protein